MAEAEVLTLDDFRRTKFSLPVRGKPQPTVTDEGEPITDIIASGKSNLPAVITKSDLVAIDRSLLTRTIQFAAANLELLNTPKPVALNDATRGDIMKAIRAMKDNLG